MSVTYRASSPVDAKGYRAPWKPKGGRPRSAEKAQLLTRNDFVSSEVCQFFLSFFSRSGLARGESAAVYLYAVTHTHAHSCSD